jgi:superfamily I DNA/RNA helicase
MERAWCADSIHKYFARIIAEAGLKERLDRKAASSTAQEMYDDAFADLFIEAAGKLGREKYDLLVVDEGQDLLNDPYLLALDQVLKGGMQNGNWVVFLDPGAQARLFNKFSQETYKYLKGLGAPEYRLDMNCRNTVQIATQASIVSGFPTGKAKVTGPKVEYVTYKDDSEQASKIVELVQRLVEEEDVPPSCITVLSTRARNSMSLFTNGAKLPRFLQELDERTVVETDTEKTGIASVQSYKGLENNVIVYCDVDRMEDEWIEGVNYVGMTRAREKLYVLLHRRLREKYEARMLEYATHQQRNAK